MRERRWRILIDLSFYSAYWRGVIEGVATYCRLHPGVSYGLPQAADPLSEGLGEPDGMIARMDDSESARRAESLGTRLVNVSSTSYGLPFPSVSTDGNANGRLAAEHLLSHGYTTFACHMDSRVRFSNERLTGFRQRLAEMGREVHVFDSSPERGASEEPAALRAATADWLGTLRKPLGLLTHNDARALGLLGILRRHGIRVPEEVGVVGVDNDAFLDDSSFPTLSSIDNAPSIVGYRAAEMLVSIMECVPPTAHLLVAPQRVVQRQSTGLVLADPLLAQAVALIREHACEPLDVYQVLEAVPLSRRSLERRFRLCLGRSPAEEILRVRMAHARMLLVDSDLSIGKIAKNVGYGHARNFASAFQRESGMEPRAYQALHRLKR